MLFLKYPVPINGSGCVLSDFAPKFEDAIGDVREPGRCHDAFGRGRQPLPDRNVSHETTPPTATVKVTRGNVWTAVVKEGPATFGRPVDAASAREQRDAKKAKARAPQTRSDDLRRCGMPSAPPAGRAAHRRGGLQVPVRGVQQTAHDGSFWSSDNSYRSPARSGRGTHDHTKYSINPTITSGLCSCCSRRFIFAERASGAS